MDRACVHQNKAPKKGNTKKKEIKVVYIDNPKKFQTSAANFRELVQKVTGQDSDIANMSDSTLFISSQESPGSSSSAPRQSEILSKGNETQLETHDDALADSWSAFVPPSMFYEPPQSLFRPRSDQI